MQSKNEIKILQIYDMFKDLNYVNSYLIISDNEIHITISDKIFECIIKIEDMVVKFIYKENI